MSADRYGDGFQRARAVALNRNPTCQFCGRYAATQAHHWARAYPSDDTVSPEDLTALCSQCHEIATTIRQHYTRSRHHKKTTHALTALQSTLSLHPAKHPLRSTDRVGMQVDEKTKNAVLQRNRRCQFCGCYVATCVHRWVFEESLSWEDNRLDNFTALCEHCNEAAAMIREHYLKEGNPLVNMQELDRVLRLYPRNALPFEERIRQQWIARTIQ